MISESQKNAVINYNKRNGKKMFTGTVYGDQVKAFEQYAQQLGVTPSKLVVLCTRRCMELDGFVYAPDGDSEE